MSYDNIVWHQCVCPFLLHGTIGTLCDVRGPSSHNGNYVFSQPDWQFFMVRAKETGREGGRKDRGRGRADLLHSCRVGWICEEWRDKKGNTVDRFVHICIFMSNSRVIVCV